MQPIAFAVDGTAELSITGATAGLLIADDAVAGALVEGGATRGRGRVARPGLIVPVVTIVTDNGCPFRSFTFEALISAHPELPLVRSRVRAPGRNASPERGFGTMKYEWLFREEINDGLKVVWQINAQRHDYNHVRPHEAIAWSRPTGLANANFETEETLPTT